VNQEPRPPNRRKPNRQSQSDPRYEAPPDQSKTRTVKESRDQLAPSQPLDSTCQMDSTSRGRLLNNSAHCAEFSAGDRLGKFIIEGELGRGAMGVVLLGRQDGIQRKAAIKLLPRSLNDNADSVNRFQREAQAIARLNHPHIIQLYDYGFDSDVHYYAMEYVKGKDLADLIYEERVSYQKAASVIAQSALALDYAHSMGVLHRDIKPANILIDKDNHARVTDFGLARMEGKSSFTMKGTVLGTPLYMPPEQAAGESRLTRQADIYSLGATLYELATGQAPYQGRDPRQIVMKVLTGAPAAPLDVDPHMPKELAAIISRAMARKPTNRYRSAREFADDLEAYIHNKPVSLKAHTAWSTTKDKSYTALFGITICIGLFLVVGLAVKAFNFSKKSTAPGLASQREKSKKVKIEKPSAETPDLDSLLEEHIKLTGTSELEAKSMASQRDIDARKELDRMPDVHLLGATRKRAQSLAEEAKRRFEEGDKARAQAIMTECLGLDPNNFTAHCLEIEILKEDEEYEDVIHKYTMFILNNDLDKRFRNKVLFQRGLLYQQFATAVHDMLSVQDLSRVEGALAAKAQMLQVRLHLQHERLALAYALGESFLKDARTHAYVSVGSLSRAELAESYLLHAQLSLKIGRSLEESHKVLVQARKLADDDDLLDRIDQVNENINAASKRAIHKAPKDR
jgi:serine/threonine protein kinase